MYMYVLVLISLCSFLSGFGTPFPDRNIFISPCPEESERDLTDFTRDSGEYSQLEKILSVTQLYTYVL